MIENQHVYLVMHVSEYDDLVDMVYGYFDTLQKAEAFKNRFKENEELKIIEKPLNPSFLEDKNNTCYLVELLKEESVPSELEIMSDIESSVSAKNKEYDLHRSSKTGEVCLISLHVFAPSEEEAVIEAKKIRAQSIARGEWKAVSA